MNPLKIQWRVISTMGEELQTVKFDDRDDADECARELMKDSGEHLGPPEVRIVREATCVERLPVWVSETPEKPGYWKMAAIK